MSERASGSGSGRAEWYFDASLLLALTAVLLCVAAASTAWRLQHDAPIMFYQAFLMERFGWVPYRDFFDMNMPGTYLAYFGLGKVFGYSDFPLRIADLLLLGAISLATVSFVRRVSIRAAWAAPVLFALLYLRLGPDVALQRECLVVLAVGLAVSAAVSSLGLPLRSALSGIAVGLAATVKPQSAIALLPLLGWFVVEVRTSARDRRPAAVAVACSLAGFAVPLAVGLVWMSAVGVLADFIHSVGYLAYYGALTGQHYTIEGGERVVYTVTQLFALGGYRWWLPIAAAGFFVILRHGTLDANQRRQVGLHLGMLASFALYPASSGQFWTYHWLPLGYWLCVAASLNLAALRSGSSQWIRWGTRLAFLVLAVHVTDVANGFEAHRRHGSESPKQGRPDRIADFLRDNAREGDSVQPLDWAAVGAVHGMLLAEASPATSFLYSFHFYHHVSTPYIQDLRARFIDEFDEADPAFVIEGRRGPDVPWVFGEDTSPRFPELEARLLDRYVPALRAPMFTIWERRTHAEPGSAGQRPPAHSM